MATIFVSHSSKDDEMVSRLEKWLRESGFNDLFVDHSSIEGGANWANALRESAGAARVVICVVTPNWLASGECPSEFKAAWYMGKMVIPLFALGEEANLSSGQKAELSRVRSESQGIDISDFAESQEGADLRQFSELQKLSAGLKAAGALSSIGLDPTAFPTNKVVRPKPFPGLTSFGDSDADAALFFGRSREIVEVLEELRSMRASGDRRVLAILGASGAGKSSLLKAGVVPRLRREAPAWLPLRVFRPGNDALLGFATAVSETLEDLGSSVAPGTIKNNLLSAWKAANRDAQNQLSSLGFDAINQTLNEIAEKLFIAANAHAATILISIDQAEELAVANNQSADAFSDFLRVSMEANSNWQSAITIRTDSFAELQSHKRLAGLNTRGFDLRNVPVFRFDSIIEAPAKRYGVEVTPELIDALMLDAPDQDALPLLAFALEQLWEQFASEKTLSVSHYTSMGGISGLIEDAAERALAGLEPDINARNSSQPQISKHANEIGKSSFVPALADINEEGAPIRRVADWAYFSNEQKKLLERFDRWRLVVRKYGGENGDVNTVEVAHEALFREWQRLEGWLDPERAKLQSLRELKQASLIWDRNNRDFDSLVHFGERLRLALSLRVDDRYSRQLTDLDFSYLSAADDKQAHAARQSRRLKLIAAAAGVAVFASGVAYLLQNQIDFALNRYVWSAASSPGELLSAEPGFEFKECRFRWYCPEWLPEMVIIPSGDFQMGAIEPSKAIDPDELPSVNVQISAFAVAKFELTHAQWQACVDFTDQDSLERQKQQTRAIGEAYWVGCSRADSSNFGRETRPVINVSWNDAYGYIRWLNLMVFGDPNFEGYRLITEAEWEYVARNPDNPNSTFGWGDDDPICQSGLRNSAVFASCVGGGAEPVGFSTPNAYGVFDMQGNVWEWVADCYTTDLSTQPQDGTSKELEDCRARVLRGGSWNDEASTMRVSDRFGGSADFPYFSIGFRIARSLD